MATSTSEWLMSGTDNIIYQTSLLKQRQQNQLDCSLLTLNSCPLCGMTKTLTIGQEIKCTFHNITSQAQIVQ
jgi:hypothetical protein